MHPVLTILQKDFWKLLRPSEVSRDQWPAILQMVHPVLTILQKAFGKLLSPSKASQEWGAYLENGTSDFGKKAWWSQGQAGHTLSAVGGRQLRSAGHGRACRKQSGGTAGAVSWSMGPEAALLSRALGNGWQLRLLKAPAFYFSHSITIEECRCAEQPKEWRWGGTRGTDGGILSALWS